MSTAVIGTMHSVVDDVDLFSLGALDAATRGVARALRESAVPIAHSAARFVEGREWRGWGSPRLSSFCAIYLNVSERWLRETAALGRALVRWPMLEAAMLGTDGGAPLGVVVASLIARLPEDAPVEAWIALARERGMTVRRFRERLRELQGGEPPTPREPLVSMEIAAPRGMTALLDECKRLAEAVVGRSLSMTGFIELLLAEQAASGAESSGSPEPRTFAASTNSPDVPTVALGDRLDPDAAALVAEAQRLLSRMVCFAESGHLVALLELRDRLLQLSGELLAVLQSRRPWRVLGFRSLVDYAKRALGMSATEAEDRARLARGLRAFPLLAAEYRAQGIRKENLKVALRVLSRASQVDAELELKWASHAERCTVRRLRDEERWQRRVDGAPAEPLRDADWLKSIELSAAGMERSLKELAARVVLDPEPVERLRFRLPGELAVELERAMRSAAGECTRMFAAFDPSYSAWKGLFALLVGTGLREWVPVGVGARPSLHDRFGYRCAAPGCSSQRNLELHHIVYRSHGGSDEDWNLIPLCSSCHRHGVHAGLMRLSGQAPLGVVVEMGDGARRSCWRNERYLGRRAMRPARTLPPIT